MVIKCFPPWNFCQASAHQQRIKYSVYLTIMILKPKCVNPVGKKIVNQVSDIQISELRLSDCRYKSKHTFLLLYISYQV